MAILAAAIVLVALLVAGWLRTRASSATSADVAATASQIAAELDVLAISLYTEETIQDGQVVQASEYEAARNAVARARANWERIRGTVSPDERAAIDDLFDQLARAVDSRAPAAEVQAIVAELQTRLRSLAAAPAG